MIVECAECKAYVDAVKVGEFGYSGTEDYDPGRYIFFRCNRCSSPILAVQEHRGFPDDDDVWTSPKVIYPQPDFRVNPKAPSDIRAALEEGIACYQAKAFTAAAIMCRKTLEGVCTAHGVTEKTLDKSLKKMAETDMIDKRLYEWSDQLRIAGNEAAHGVGVVSSAQDARDALEFTTGIIDYLFSYRDQFEKFKARRHK